MPKTTFLSIVAQKKKNISSLFALRCNKAVSIQRWSINVLKI